MVALDLVWCGSMNQCLVTLDVIHAEEVANNCSVASAVNDLGVQASAQ